MSANADTVGWDQMDLPIIPLAITMVAGPQIMSAILFVTTPRVVRVSLAFIAGVTIGVTVGVCAARGLASLVNIGSSQSSGSGSKTVQLILVGLLMALMLRNYLGRKTAEPPKWLGKLMDATPRQAFMAGLLLLSIFPSDAMVLLTVGSRLEHEGLSVVAALPFIGLTILLASLPFISYMLFRGPASRAMPRVRDWMNTNSWLVNIIVLAIFVLLILG